MQRSFYCLLCSIILTCFINTSYAAFPVTPKQSTELSATHAYSAHKNFSERRIPRLLHRAEEKILSTARPEKHKTSWPGIVSLASAVMVIAAVFALPVLCIPLSVVAIVFGIIGVNKRYRLRGLALAGFALGVIELMIGLTVWAIISILKSITINVM